MSLDTNDNQSHQENPQAVDYAPAGTRRPLARRVLRHPLFWVVAVVLSVWLSGLRPHDVYDSGYHKGVCTHCGARHEYDYVRIFNKTWRYNEQFIEGAISKHIQAHEQKACGHQWETGYRSSRWVRAQYRGRSLYCCIMSVERYPDADLYLDRRIREDPDFIDKLTHAVRSSPSFTTFWEGIGLGTFEQSQISPPIAQPGTPASNVTPSTAPASQPAHSARQRDTN